MNVDEFRPKRIELLGESAHGGACVQPTCKRPELADEVVRDVTAVALEDLDLGSCPPQGVYRGSGGIVGAAAAPMEVVGMKNSHRVIACIP